MELLQALLVVQGGRTVVAGPRLLAAIVPQLQAGGAVLVVR